MPEPTGGKTDFTTIIGPDATFKGEVTFETGLRIEGKFEGKLTTKGRLHVGKGAELKAEVQVGTVNVEGQVRGNITAMEKVEIAASAQVFGDIRTPRLIVAEGATLVGNMQVTPDAVKDMIPGKPAKVEERELAAAKAR